LKIQTGGLQMAFFCAPVLEKHHFRRAILNFSSLAETAGGNSGGFVLMWNQSQSPHAHH
jgi:hypothetical protein